MPLPALPLDTGSLTIRGTTITFRSMSRADAIALGQMSDDPAGAEVLMLSSACGITPEEAAAWRAATMPPDVGALLDEIAVLSGIRKRKGADPKAAASSSSSSAG